MSHPVSTNIASKSINSVAIYCGSRLGNDPDFQKATQQLAEWLAQQNIRIVYGGGNTGLMGVLADSAVAAGGKVIGVLPHSLTHKETPHTQIDIEYVESMHDRKARMVELADAFIALPGGIGTLDELIEIWCWHGMGHHQKPCICFDVNEFWQPFFALLEHSKQADFVYHDSLPERVSSLAELSVCLGRELGS